MKMASTRPSRRSKAGIWVKAFPFLAMTLLAGCNHVPSQNILGSYFPSWMLCAVGGITVSALVHQLLSRMKIVAFIPARLIVYVALAVALTFLFWLLWFGN